MSDYNSKSKIGGYINSKIDNQDSIAAIYAVQLLCDEDIFMHSIFFHDFSMVCEGNDDIEIMSNEYHVFIQVKSSKIDKADILKILDSFCANDEIENEKESLFVISAFDPIVFEQKNFTDRLLFYEKVKKNKFENPSRIDSIKNSLISDFDLLKYDKIIDRIHIDKRPLFRDVEDTRAIFARYLRKVYGFRDQGEHRIDILFNILCEKFAELRRNRDNISRTELEKILGNELCKASWYSGVSLILGYKKLENGYVQDHELDIKRTNIANGVRKAYKKIMHEWRKAYLKEILVSIILSAKRCPQCGHPMMANIYGMNGIACPDCGYAPYVSLVLCCECGEYELIKAQPEIFDDSIFNYLNDFFRARKDTTCKKCGKDLLDEFVELRTIMVNVPIPFDKYKNINVIYENSLDVKFVEEANGIPQHKDG